MSSSSSSSNESILELREAYTAKSLVVFGAGGNSRVLEYKTELTSIGGKSNNFEYGKQTNGGVIKAPGYVFSNKRLEDVKKLVAKINSGSVVPSVIQSRQSGTSSKANAPSVKMVSIEEFMRLMARVEVLENEVGLLRARETGTSNPRPRMMVEQAPSESGNNKTEVEEFDDEDDSEEQTVVPVQRRMRPTQHTK